MSISGFQVLTKDFHLELLRTTGTALERLVVTDLGGGALPLIRFDTEDLVRRDTARPGAPIVAIGRGAVDGLQAAQGECLTPYEVELALDRAEKFLGLAALVAVLLAAVAVALAKSRYLRRHLDAAAMMRRINEQPADKRAHQTDAADDTLVVRRDPGLGCRQMDLDQPAAPGHELGLVSRGGG